MCGIVYAHDFDGKPVNNAIMQVFDEQRARGTEGFGLFDGQEMNMVRASKEDKILKWLVKYDSNLIMFHHRNPTSTVNVARAAHPFSTKGYFGDDQYVLVHNGIIYNSRERKEAHEKMGITYQSVLQDGTFNDSEALLWDVALYLEGKIEKVEARGAIAFVCMKTVKKGLNKLYFARNSNPLNMYRSKGGVALSSEGPGESIESGKLYTFNYQLKRLTSRPMVLNQYSTYTPSTTTYGRDYRSGGPYAWEDDYTGFSKDMPGGWLSPKLRDKFNKYLVRKEHEILDYDRDGNPLYDENYYRGQSGLYLPEGERDGDLSVLTEEEIEDLEMYSADFTEVQSKAMQYMGSANGNFEMAYWLVESDYDDVAFGDGTDEDVLKETRLLEQVMEYINSDPEYENENSVSSIWSALWNQQSLIKK